MQTNLEKAKPDHSAQWIALSSRVRTLAIRLSEKAHGTPLEADAVELLREIPKLCDHLERIHREAGNLLTELVENLPEPTIASPSLELDEVQREALQIHRETHELRADFMDIIKALFMWQDDPAERVQKKS